MSGLGGAVALLALWLVLLAAYVRRESRRMEAQTKAATFDGARPHDAELVEVTEAEWKAAFERLVDGERRGGAA